MIKLVMCLGLLILTTGAQAQRFKLKGVNQKAVRMSNAEGMFALHPEADSAGFTWLAHGVLELDTILPKTLMECYTVLREKGNKMGANAFRITDANIYGARGHKYIETDLYYLDWEDRDANLALHRSNKVYLFGFLGHHERIAGYRIVVNGKKVLMEELQYRTVTLKAGDRLHILLGKGMRADEVVIQFTQPILPRYFYFMIFKGVVSKNRIFEYDWSYGEFLRQVLRGQELPLEN